MKKIIAGSAVVFCTLVLLQSCTKSSTKDLAQNTPTRPDRIINAKVAPGQTYTVSIGHSGTLSIDRQASHFKISQTGIDPKNNSLVYSYSPVEGFKGNDEVVLAHKTESVYNNNSSCNYGSNDNMGSRTSFIAVKITVAD